MTEKESQEQSRRNSAAIRGEPVSRAALKPAEARGAKQLNYRTPDTTAFVAEKVPITFRQKEDRPERRRYYVGYVQIAYASFDSGNWTMVLTNGKDEASLKGVSFDKEADMHTYLKKELLG